MAVDQQARQQISALNTRVVALETWRTVATAQISALGVRLTAAEAELADHEARLIVLET